MHEIRVRFAFQAVCQIPPKKTSQKETPNGRSLIQPRFTLQRRAPQVVKACRNARPLNSGSNRVVYLTLPLPWHSQLTGGVDGLFEGTDSIRLLRFAGAMQ